MASAFPHLAHLLGAYFHQDFGMTADTVEEVVAEYLQSATSDAVQGVRADIERFLRVFPHDTTAQFERIFEPDVDPAGWGLSVAAFLAKIHGLLGGAN